MFAKGVGSHGQRFSDRGLFSCPIPQRQPRVVILDGARGYHCLTQSNIVVPRPPPIFRPLRQPLPRGIQQFQTFDGANTEESSPALRFLARIEPSWHWIPQRIDPGLRLVVLSLSGRDPVVSRVLARIDGVYDGSSPDIFTSVEQLDGLAIVGTRAGKHWRQLNAIDNPWFLEHIVRNPADHPKTSTVGDLIFFS